GCNALDYLLDKPSAVHAIDLNARQNALLELKKVAIDQLSHDQLFQLFGEGRYDQVKALYHSTLRANLPSYAQDYWDKKIRYFNGRGLRKSFYFFGTSGILAFLMRGYFNLRPRLKRLVQDLFEAPTLQVQEQIYASIEPLLFSHPVKWLSNRHFMLALAGVPRAQRQLLIADYPGGVGAYLTDAFRHIFIRLPIQENYFYSLYWKGHYEEQRCPNYLKAAHYEDLKPRLDQLKVYTTSISAFLQDHPGAYSHYVLLDHQEWFASYQKEALEEEWQLILKNSQPGTKILIRSAATQIDFFPDFVLEKVSFEKELTQQLHTEDRVGMYGSVYLGTVNE
ncbi:MAG: BtaA family protein, partial [Bacteroidota bacterium]